MQTNSMHRIFLKWFFVHENMTKPPSKVAYSSWIIFFWYTACLQCPKAHFWLKLITWSGFCHSLLNISLVGKNVAWQDFLAKLAFFLIYEQHTPRRLCSYQINLFCFFGWHTGFFIWKKKSWFRRYRMKYIRKIH